MVAFNSVAFQWIPLLWISMCTFLILLHTIPNHFFFIFTSLGIVLIYKLVQTRGIIFPQEAIFIFRRCTDINWYEFRHISCVAGWGYWSPVLKETHRRSYTQANLSVLPALRANNQSNFWHLIYYGINHWEKDLDLVYTSSEKFWSSILDFGFSLYPSPFSWNILFN